ncbi:glutaminyl-tRNA synthetase [Xylaria curta]|nr:glutaminyl-tRNA synthetase [Xylaria curta]
MADTIIETTAKLQLDEETGEMVSKNELKKNVCRSAPRKLPRLLRAVNTRLTHHRPAAGASKQTSSTSTQLPWSINQGFLAEISKLRPSKTVVTRFQPEPNGYLHLEHAKAIAINFGFARYHGGKTKEDYFVSIKDTIQWLGFTPAKITYASDNFQRLYDLVEELIKQEKAYVCHCNEAETKMQRGGEDGSKPRYRCEHAKQDIQTNLRKFRGMRDGDYAPQAAWLRMKQDMESPNPQTWDIAAYRIPKNQEPHFRTGTKWRIYPTYDFAHCLCDSFEDITHSLCTSEFTMSRESYTWLNHTIMSKRDIRNLIEKGIVRDWDDPRLYTLKAIRRRGTPPGALLSFINELGVTTATGSIEMKRFEQSIQRYLEKTVPRLMLVLDPVLIVIEDIEEQDLDVDSKDYFRLAPGKTVGILHMPFPIKAETRAVFDRDTKKPKAFIHWVPEGSHTAEVRIHTALFEPEQPSSAPGGFPNDLVSGSERIWPSATVEAGFHEVRRRAPWPEAEGEKTGDFEPESVRFQAIRVGYFVSVDSDSTDNAIVLNRIVPLKEDSGKSE